MDKYPLFNVGRVNRKANTPTELKPFTEIVEGAPTDCDTVEKKMKAPWIQMMNCGYRVDSKNFQNNFTLLNGFRFIDLDVKNYTLFNEVDLDIMQKKLYVTAKQDYGDNFYCIQRSVSGKGFTMLFYFDVEKTKENYDKCSVLLLQWQEHLLKHNGYGNMFDKKFLRYTEDDQGNKEYHYVVDRCYGSVYQGKYVSGYHTDYNDSCNGTIDLSNVVVPVKKKRKYKVVDYNVDRSQGTIPHFPHDRRITLFCALLQIHGGDEEKAQGEWEALMERMPEGKHDTDYYIEEPIRGNFASLWHNDTNVSILREIGYEVEVEGKLTPEQKHLAWLREWSDNANNIRRNERTGTTLYYNGEKWVDPDYEKLYLNMIDAGLPSVTKNKVVEMVNALASQKTYDPLKEYLCRMYKSEAYDVEKLETFFIRHLQAENTPLTRTLTRKFLVASVARVESKEVYEFPNMLCLKGGTGIGKTFIYKALYNIEDCGVLVNQNINTKLTAEEIASKLEGAWCLDMSEREGLNKATNNAYKKFTDNMNAKLQYKKKYENLPTTVTPRCVVAVSTNDDKFISDPTVDHDRRMWVIDCKKKTIMNEKERKAILAERDLIWATAVKIWRNENPSTQLNDEEIKLMAQDQDKYKTIGHDEVEEWCDKFENTKFPHENGVIPNQDMFNRCMDSYIELSFGNDASMIYADKIPVKMLKCSIEKTKEYNKYNLVRKELEKRGWVEKQVKISGVNTRCLIRPATRRIYTEATRETQPVENEVVTNSSEMDELKPQSQSTIPTPEKEVSNIYTKTKNKEEHELSRRQDMVPSCGNRTSDHNEGKGGIINEVGEKSTEQLVLVKAGKRRPSEGVKCLTPEQEMAWLEGFDE